MKIIKFIVRIPELLYRCRIKQILKLKYKVYVKKPFYIVGAQYIKVGKLFKSAEGVRLEAWDKHNYDSFCPDLEIGDNAFLNTGTHISTIQNLVIGDNFLTGSYVSIIDNNHGHCQSFEELIVPPAERHLYSKGPITIGNNVWIGDKACVFGGVTIGDGAVIGANAVVTSNIPAYSVAVGNPARVIKCWNKRED